MGFLSKYSPQILGVLRIIVGLLFLEHGLMKIAGFPAPMGTGPLPPLMMAAGIIELVAGALIALGLFSRIAAFIASGEMAAAYFMAHFPRGIYPAQNGGDAAILFCFIFLYLAAAGPGAFAINDK
ncbi:MAG TPA: DoxX family protein [Rhizomicrobium sp.]|jgi:putative oxidoreductase|nr:DoxX family protein [Rhizomicrobium sp.]